MNFPFGWRGWTMAAAIAIVGKLFGFAGIAILVGVWMLGDYLIRRWVKRPVMQSIPHQSNAAQANSQGGDANK